MTQTAQHTPGPWKIIQTATHFGLTDNEGFPVLRINGGMVPVEANARLIAAVPDLLAALKKAEYYLNRFYVLAINCADDPRYLIERDAINEAQLAICKATIA